MDRANLKRKFRNRSPVLAGWTSLGHPQIAEMLCRSGVDFLGIDLEHSTISQEQAQCIIAASQASGVACIPRVASHNSESIRRLLDSGADGVLVPTVENSDQVRRLIEWVKYPPIGRRGFGVARAQGYGHDFEGYVSHWNETSVLILQIESINAVEHIDDLLQFDEVDGVMIGPYDLSGSLGIPGQINSDRVLEASRVVLASCERHLKACGTHLIQPDSESIQTAWSDGYTFLALASDVFVLQKWGEDTHELIRRFRD